jgi:hypothetical protein
MDQLEGGHMAEPPETIERPMVTPVKAANKYWYAVGQGREGAKVYTDWGDAGPMVNGFSGDMYQRFRTLEAA